MDGITLLGVALLILWAIIAILSGRSTTEAEPDCPFKPGDDVVWVQGTAFVINTYGSLYLKPKVQKVFQGPTGPMVTVVLPNGKTDEFLASNFILERKSHAP